MNKDDEILKSLAESAAAQGLDLQGCKVRRTSSRFCFGVEHGDYNGTELFGVGTDRFIWLAFKPNNTDKVRIFSSNFPDDGLIEFPVNDIPGPLAIKDSWARFPYGAAYILMREGYAPIKGFDAVLVGDIPGGGMSRSASLAINLLLTFAEVNGIEFVDGMRVVDLAQMVENDYIGSPCGKLDQIMIYFARANMGTHFNPADNSITHVPLGSDAEDFRIISLDTGTVRPGLEKSTYRIRRSECEELAALARVPFGIKCLADVREEHLYNKLRDHFGESHPKLVKRLDYIYNAQNRFYEMMDAWKAGNIAGVGSHFRADGIGLRDQYQISGPELETMVDIARTVPGVFGERMLGGGDKGASGAICRADAVDALRAAVDTGYPRAHPAFAHRYAMHVCQTVDGVTELPGW